MTLEEAHDSEASLQVHLPAQGRVVRLDQIPPVEGIVLDVESCLAIWQTHFFKKIIDFQKKYVF